MKSLSSEKEIKSFEKRQMVLLGLGLLILAGLSVIFNFIYLSGQAEQTAAFLKPLIQSRDFRTVTSVLEAARAEHFRAIRFTSPEDDLKFVLPASAALFTPSLWSRLTNDQINVRTAAARSSTGHADLAFEFNRFGLVPHAFIIWILILLISLPPTRLMKKRLTAKFEQDLINQRDILRADLARKVRHNIRNPLAALTHLSDTVQGLKRAELDLFHSIIGQVRQIVSELDECKQAQAETDLEKIPIYDCIRDSYRELKLSLPENFELLLELDEGVLSAQVRFIYHELRSLIANLCQNSREAIDGAGEIKISARDFGNKVVISVQDNGCGIPPALIEKVTEKHFSFGKDVESGLGLFLASEHAKEWGGKLEIQSELGRGTCVSVHLPVTDRASWYLPRVKLQNDDTVVIVDDQVSVHRLWDIRLNDDGFLGKRFYFYSGEEAGACHALSALEPERSHVFMDHDLGDEHLNGLKVLETQFLNWQRYLVTGNFDDSEVRTICEKQKLPLIPKTEVTRIPIVVCSRS
jgi:signal transduction histidine kinase